MEREWLSPGIYIYWLLHYKKTLSLGFSFRYDLHIIEITVRLVKQYQYCFRRNSRALIRKGKTWLGVRTSKWKNIKMQHGVCILYLDKS